LILILYGNNIDFLLFIIVNTMHSTCASLVLVVCCMCAFSAEALVSIPKKSEIPLNYMIVEVCTYTSRLVV